MKLSLDKKQRELIASALQAVENQLTRLGQDLMGSLVAGMPVPSELESLQRDVQKLKGHFGREFHPDPFNFDFDERESRIIRTALAITRRSKAEQVEARQVLLAAGALSEALVATLAPFNSLLNDTPLSDVEPITIPRLADYLTAQGRQSVEMVPTLAPEERDPKHRILLSSSLIANDILSYRRQCEDRRQPFAVVFADLDDFKKFNDALGEVQVDRQVLPAILSSVERATYGHGRAYRHGGDEFVILLPNSDETVAKSLLTGLKTSVEAHHFDGVATRTSLSVGVWITAPESHLTASELIEAASKAKAKSKADGKNQITIRRERASGYRETVVK